MKTSENINELGDRLALAQSTTNRFDESVLIPKIVNQLYPIKNKHVTNGKKTRLDRFTERLCFGLSDCWYFRGSKNEHGYGKFGKSLAHRVSWHMLISDIPKGMQVLHSCDVRNCVNPKHLFLGTHKDNMNDMAKKGRRKNITDGEQNGMAKLSVNEVTLIRSNQNPTSAEILQLASQFNVSRSTIYRVIKKESWNNL